MLLFSSIILSLLLQAFCFKNKQSNAFVHAGVLEFTSPLEKTVYLPQWMFEHLNVSNGKFRLKPCDYHMI